PSLSRFGASGSKSRRALSCKGLRNRSASRLRRRREACCALRSGAFGRAATIRGAHQGQLGTRPSGAGVKQSNEPVRARPEARVASRVTRRRLILREDPQGAVAQTTRGRIMRIERRYTKAGQSPYADIQFRLTASEIRNPDGSVVFRADDVEVPSDWSQVAADVLAQKYFRKAGVPARLKKVEEETVPSWLWRSVPDEETIAELREKERSTAERSCKQVFERLAGTWTYWGWKGGYFDAEEDARAFFDEHVYMLAMQMAAPNSPQWFNTGLHWAY